MNFNRSESTQKKKKSVPWIKPDFNLYKCFRIPYTGIFVFSIHVEEIIHKLSIQPEKGNEYICAQNTEKYFKFLLENLQPKIEDEQESWATTNLTLP